MRILGALLLAALIPPISAQSPNWSAVDAEALKTLQNYIRINTSVPPGDVTKAADLLAGHPRARGDSGQALRIRARPIDRAGAAEGLWASEADPSSPPHGRRPGRREPLGARSVRRRDRRRQDLGPRRDGHEGAGRGAPLRLHHAEAAERPARPRHSVDGGARRGSGRRARRGVDAREALSGARPRVHPRRRRLRQPGSLRARGNWCSAFP